MKLSALQLLASTVSLVELAAAQSTTQCAPLHMIVARGSLESQSNGGIGLLSLVTSAVEAQVPGADAYGIVYPATIANYSVSVADGDSAMTAAITSYSTSCPDSRLALLGYSQGGQVVGDALCGNSESGFQQTAPIALQYTTNLVAIVSAADPANTKGVEGITELGNATMYGGFPRRDLTSCAPYAGRYGLWCNADDLFCAGGKSLTVHLQVIPLDQTEMTQYIVSRYYASIGKTAPNVTSSASSTATVAPTSLSAALSSAMATTSAPAMNGTSPVMTATAPYQNSTIAAPTLTSVVTSQASSPASTTTATAPTATAAAPRLSVGGVLAGAGAVAAFFALL